MNRSLSVCLFCRLRLCRPAKCTRIDMDWKDVCVSQPKIYSAVSRKNIYLDQTHVCGKELRCLWRLRWNFRSFSSWSNLQVFICSFYIYFKSMKAIFFVIFTNTRTLLNSIVLYPTFDWYFSATLNLRIFWIQSVKIW